MALLALADEGPAKFYYTLNKPACSPMRSRHYRVSGVMDTVKCLYYYYYHNPDSSSVPGCYVSASLFMGAWERIRLLQFYVCKLLVIKLQHEWEIFLGFLHRWTDNIKLMRPYMYYKFLQLWSLSECHMKMAEFSFVRRKFRVLHDYFFAVRTNGR